MITLLGRTCKCRMMSLPQRPRECITPLRKAVGTVGTIRRAQLTHFLIYMVLWGGHACLCTGLTPPSPKSGSEVPYGIFAIQPVLSKTSAGTYTGFSFEDSPFCCSVPAMGLFTPILMTQPGKQGGHLIAPSHILLSQRTFGCYY